MMIEAPVSSATARLSYPARAAAGQPGARGNARFVPLTPELLRMIELRADDRKFRAMLTADAIMSALLLHGWAMIEGPHVLAAGGVAPVAQGRGVGWLAFSARVRPRHVVMMYRFGRQISDALIAAGEFQRIEATARADFPGAQNVAEHMGLVRECLMPRWADGEDHALYSLVKP